MFGRNKKMIDMKEPLTIKELNILMDLVEDGMRHADSDTEACELENLFHKLDLMKELIKINSNKEE